MSIVRAVLVLALAAVGAPLLADPPPSHCSGDPLSEQKRHAAHSYTFGEECDYREDPHFSTGANAGASCSTAGETCQSCAACCNSRGNKHANCDCVRMPAGAPICRAIARLNMLIHCRGLCIGTHETDCEGIDWAYELPKPGEEGGE
jgi:hypothetical protein